MKKLIGAFLICIGLYCFFQSGEYQDLINDMDCENTYVKIVYAADCEEYETLSNLYFYSGIGTIFFGLFLMFKK